MKKVILLCFWVLCSISVYAQIHPSYWETFNIEQTQKTANNGDADAQFVMAVYYKEIAYDNEQFKYWIEKAERQNHPNALCLIAQMHFIGDHGFSVNEAKALEYARKAASLNSIQGICMMAEAYKTAMFGLSQDDMQAAYWFEKGARLGNDYCQERLGSMYMVGIGVLKDEKTGLYWLHKSADQKNINAQCSLIIYYDTQNDKESRNKLMSIGLDFLINPAIHQNSEDILIAKGIVGAEFFNRKNYKKGIQLMREGLKSQNELLQFYWRTMNAYAQEVLGTTLYALENQ